MSFPNSNLLALPYLCSSLQSEVSAIFPFSHYWLLWLMLPSFTSSFPSTHTKHYHGTSFFTLLLLLASAFTWDRSDPHSSWPLIMSWSRLFQSPRGYLPADSLVLCKSLDIWLPDPPTARLNLMLPLQELDLGLRPFNCAIFSQPLQMRLFQPSRQTGLLDLANKV